MRYASPLHKPPKPRHSPSPSAALGNAACHLAGSSAPRAHAHAPASQLCQSDYRHRCSLHCLADRQPALHLLPADLLLKAVACWCHLASQPAPPPLGRPQLLSAACHTRPAASAAQPQPPLPKALARSARRHRKCCCSRSPARLAAAPWVQPPWHQLPVRPWYKLLYQKHLAAVPGAIMVLQQRRLPAAPAARLPPGRTPPYQKYLAAVRGAIMVLFSMVSVKYLTSLCSLSSKMRMEATLPQR
jgi:hypothetical protein